MKKSNNKKIYQAKKKSQSQPKRESLITVRLTEEEKEIWKAKAEAAGLGNNLSLFIRECVENSNTVVRMPVSTREFTPKTYEKMGRIGNNLNQIARGINRAIKMNLFISGDPRAEDEALKELFLEIKSQINQSK
ncbi:MAG: MobC family plasmid mobilization relaxosome protein [Richelia sp. RM1_1_1]|nr:MobC family plasmid mobilization relaxosome protein [Richelia sp. RM1_1_1]